MKLFDRMEAFAFVLGLLGAALLLSPWLLDYVGHPSAAPSAVLIGGAMIVIAALSALRPSNWWAAASLTLGAWQVVAPVALGFLDEAAAAWVHVGTGLAAMVLAVLAEDWSSRVPPELPT